MTADALEALFRETLAEAPLIAILRGIRPSEVEAIGAVLVESGIRLIEVPLNSPDPFNSIARLVNRFGDAALIGAGTVTQPDDVLELADIGVDGRVRAGGGSMTRRSPAAMIAIKAPGNAACAMSTTVSGTAAARRPVTVRRASSDAVLSSEGQ